ncbi:AAA family ATPase [Actinomycetospora sp. TBRC 11914]|uniref:AAA family ATPase n=1 Tax=Actinomycetospora sp. TBRC 11914 TaxID=2729387 RepID=UPI00145D7B0E|nr:AAA family ATPase [Actinomycetospora sp. TBRC 11914]NMO89023.1 AAA family ATPase [Actinomycetospora sp. TBRC 11914]
MSTAGSPQVTLTAQLSTSATDARRGVVRLHTEVFAALGLAAWDAVRVVGTRATVALAAPATGPVSPGTATLDETAMVNAGIVAGTAVAVEPVAVTAARTLTVAGSRLASTAVAPETVRLALTGKVVTPGDTVSLLPQDLAPVPGADAVGTRTRLSAELGGTWTTELVTVVAAEPGSDAAYVVGPSTVVEWQGGARTGSSPDPVPPAAATPSSFFGGVPTSRGAAPGPGLAAAVAGASSAPAPVSSPAPAAPPEPPPPAVSDLVGHQDAARRLGEWFELVFHRPELLTRLGAAPRLGVLVVGPEGVGRTTLVRSVAAEARAGVVVLDAPAAAALEAGAAAERVRTACRRAREAATGDARAVLLVPDVEALLPASDPPPLATVVLDELRAVVASERVALVATAQGSESVEPRLRAPDLVDRELGLAAPDDRDRAELLRVLLREVPLAGDADLGVVGLRTPGFVAADLVALRREAAVRAALRSAGDSGDAGELRLSQDDLLGAVTSVRPVALSSSGSQTLHSGGLTLDDVGDMTETKQALTETVLWPLSYPDSFARLGVDPPRGVLLYGPPGGGKTFLMRALAGTGRLNVFVVKGAELLDKYVGESERAVRELFRRAADAAPALVFLDEVDALAPRRGGSSDAGVADRVVAALLTELDGATPLRDVVVLGATNRPELIDPALLRPGRLERQIYVPPPDAPARAAILRAAAKATPLAPDVDLDALAESLEGYSAADCAALVREAALTAMRASLDSTEVTAAQFEAARQVVRPSLDPRQLAELEAYASRG